MLILVLILILYHSADWLDLSYNSLMGMIPSEIGLLTYLCEFSCHFLLSTFFRHYCAHCSLAFSFSNILQIPYGSTAMPVMP